MNTPSQPVDLAEVASEVVRVMFTDGLSVASAVANVITSRKDLYFDRANEIGRMAESLLPAYLKAHPEMKFTLKGQRQQRQPFFSHAAATGWALAEQEAEADANVDAKAS